MHVCSPTVQRLQPSEKFSQGQRLPHCIIQSFMIRDPDLSLLRPFPLSPISACLLERQHLFYNDTTKKVPLHECCRQDRKLLLRSCILLVVGVQSVVRCLVVIRRSASLEAGFSRRCFPRGHCFQELLVQYLANGITNGDLCR